MQSLSVRWLLCTLTCKPEVDRVLHVNVQGKQRFAEGDRTAFHAQVVKIAKEPEGIARQRAKALQPQKEHGVS